MDEDPSNEAFILFLLEGYDIDEAEAMEAEPAPAQRIGEPSTSLGLIEGNFPQIGPKPNASPGWPNHSPQSMASCISVPHLVSCSGASPSPTVASLFETSMQAYVATMQRHAPSWAMRSAKALF
jgi:hypothetical protein